MDAISEIRARRDRAKAKLAKLDDVRAELTAEIAEYDAAERVLVKIQAVAPSFDPDPDDDRPKKMRIKSLVYEAVHAQQAHGATVDSIIAYGRDKHRVEINRNSVPGTLSRFKADGELVHRSDGKWFPARERAENSGAGAPEAIDDMLN